MNILKTLFPCCLSPSHDEHTDEHTEPTNEKLIAYTAPSSAADLQSTAKKTSDKLIHFITTSTSVNTSKTNIQVQKIIDSEKPSTVVSAWWTQMVLKRLYKAMTELVIKVGELKQELNPVMRKVFDEAEQFVHELEELQGEHPVLSVLIETTAFALLIALLAPFLLEALGFGAEGVVIQSLYPDVPYGSLFSKLQSFAARYGKSLCKD
jgi:hypothetical protein